MQREPRLRGLSSDHHHALVLAQRLEKLADAGRADAEVARRLAERFDRDLEPHFAVEEELLLPGLDADGDDVLVARTRADHAFLRDCATAARAGRTDELVPFARRLAEHVRFEERELFPRCEEILVDSLLDEVARRVPKES